MDSSNRGGEKPSSLIVNTDSLDRGGGKPSSPVINMDSSIRIRGRKPPLSSPISNMDSSRSREGKPLLSLPSLKTHPILRENTEPPIVSTEPPIVNAQLRSTTSIPSAGQRDGGESRKQKEGNGDFAEEEATAKEMRRGLQDSDKNEVRSHPKNIENRKKEANMKIDNVKNIMKLSTTSKKKKLSTTAEKELSTTTKKQLSTTKKKNLSATTKKARSTPSKKKLSTASKKNPSTTSKTSSAKRRRRKRKKRKPRSNGLNKLSSTILSLQYRELFSPLDRKNRYKNEVETNPRQRLKHQADINNKEEKDDPRRDDINHMKDTVLHGDIENIQDTVLYDAINRNVKNNRHHADNKDILQCRLAKKSQTNSLEESRTERISLEEAKNSEEIGSKARTRIESSTEKGRTTFKERKQETTNRISSKSSKEKSFLVDSSKETTRIVSREREKSTKKEATTKQNRPQKEPKHIFQTKIDVGKFNLAKFSARALFSDQSMATRILSDDRGFLLVGKSASAKKHWSGFK